MPLVRRGPLTREIAAVGRSLSALGRALERLAKQAKTPVREPVRPAAILKRKLHLSPARRKALQLHGKYLGYVRQLKPRAKAQVRAIRERKGIRAAIARARKLIAA